VGQKVAGSSLLSLLSIHAEFVPEIAHVLEVCPGVVREGHLLYDFHVFHHLAKTLLFKNGHLDIVVGGLEVLKAQIAIVLKFVRVSQQLN
jgi:hypothetical protein